MDEQPTPIYDLEVTAIGPLVEEFTSAGVWVFFNEQAPEELAEFALLHQAPAPRKPLAPGQVIEISGQCFAITAVGRLANEKVSTLGHLVLKANGSTESEMPVEICIDSQPLPRPSIGMRVRVWDTADEVVHESVRSIG